MNDDKPEGKVSDFKTRTEAFQEFQDCLVEAQKAARAIGRAKGDKRSGEVRALVSGYCRQLYSILSGLKDDLQMTYDWEFSALRVWRSEPVRSSVRQEANRLGILFRESTLSTRSFELPMIETVLESLSRDPDVSVELASDAVEGLSKYWPEILRKAGFAYGRLPSIAELVVISLVMVDHKRVSSYSQDRGIPVGSFRNMVHAAIYYGFKYG